MNRSGLALAAAFALASAPTEFRFSRPIEAASGWARVALPDDVLDACRPGLPDLRIEDASGREVPYAFEQDVVPGSRRLAIENLESIEKAETTGMVDRGPTPGFADAVSFEVRGSDFLKPVRVESSEDRASWKEVARGSIFAAGDVRMLTLRMPQNDRRYLRFRLDDRNGEPVRPDAVVVRARAPEASALPRERPLDIAALPSDSRTASLYAVTLPASNLDVTALRFQAQDPAFSRRVRVYERVFFRDEVFRRLVAEGTIARAPDSAAPLDLPAPGIAGRSLEIEIENGDSPALGGLGVTALTRSRSIRFFAGPGEGLRLLYGSVSARAPRYDLERASAGGVARAVAEATLGPAVAREAAAAPVPAPARVVLSDAEKWTSRRPVVLPRTGGLAYLDLDDSPRGVTELRIVDARERQVPFVVEKGSHEHRRKLDPVGSDRGTLTAVRLGEPADFGAAVAIELSASAPDYFSREAVVRQEERDQRGVVGSRTLGAARWERQPGEPAPVLRIPIDRPKPDQGPLLVEIENGNNAPIRIAEAWIVTSAVRLDFVFAPGDRLFLLSGNTEAEPPRYDFAMLASVVLAAPAEPAHLGPAAPAARPAPRLAGWFWGAVVGTVVVLVALLARTLKASP